MIVSHEHKFIFLRTKKTAGTSVQLWLSQICGQGDVLTRLPEDDAESIAQFGYRLQNVRGIFNPLPEILEDRNNSRRIWRELFKRSKFRQHMHAKTVRNRVGEKIWSSYFKFSIERNPWDRIVSSYLFRKKNEKLSFEAFLSKKHPNNWPIYTIDDRIVVDKLLKYENLEESLMQTVAMLGVRPPGPLPRAKSGYRASRNYRDFYTEETAELVRIRFANEVATFGYTF